MMEKKVLHTKLPYCMALKDLEYVSYNSYRQLLWYVYSIFCHSLSGKSSVNILISFFELHERKKIIWNDVRMKFWLYCSFKSADMMPLPRAQ